MGRFRYNVPQDSNIMSDKSEEEKIIDEAKRLNPDVSDPVVLELSSFLSSELNKAELSPSGLKQVSDALLSKLKEPQTKHED